jgi:FAD/FMN-containing dehydrogenase
MKKLITKETIEKLKNKVKGQIVLPSDLSYDKVREIWNAMIERRPALIVRCAEANDVPPTISFARENALEISIRGAGHNIAGNALCDDGVMIDFSIMRNVRVDAEKKRAYVEPGATLADFDEAAQFHGLATVVTQFEFKLHEVGPEILAGLIVFPFDQAKQVLTQYREFVESAPEELNVWVVLRKAPPLPFLPAEVHGKEVVVLATFYIGNAAQGSKLIEPLLRFGTPHGEHIGAQPYTQWQKAFDPLLTPGARNYWKSHNFTDLSDGALHSMIEFAGKLPSPQCEIFIGLIAGAANRIPADAMAYRHRDAKFVLNVHGRWDERTDDERCIDWARAFFQASAPYASAGAYVNFMTEEESDRVAAAYGANYDRLAQIKKVYDPDNLFHLNQNIKPSPRQN